jgi:hypothetical protein
MEEESMKRHPDASFNFRKQEINTIFKPQI